LQNELQNTREYLQTTIEELETSNEELQSLNEESTTVNAELQSRVEELFKANDDMKNLLDSTEGATIFLDTSLCIQRSTPTISEIIPLTIADKGRPIKHFSSRLIDFDINLGAEKVLTDLVTLEVEVTTSDNKIFQLRIRPYRTVTNVINGVVLTFTDITNIKETEKKLQRAHTELELRMLAQSDELDATEAQFQAIFAQHFDALLIYDLSDKKLLKYNRFAHEVLGYTEKEFAKLLITDIIKDFDIEQFSTRLSKANPAQEKLNLVMKHKDNSLLIINARAQLVTISDKGWLAIAGKRDK
jgi:PAS domain-containing protein